MYLKVQSNINHLTVWNCAPQPFGVFYIITSDSILNNMFPSRRIEWFVRFRHSRCFNLSTRWQVMFVPRTVMTSSITAVPKPQRAELMPTRGMSEHWRSFSTVVATRVSSSSSIRPLLFPLQLCRSGYGRNVREMNVRASSSIATHTQFFSETLHISSQLENCCWTLSCWNVSIFI